MVDLLGRSTLKGGPVAYQSQRVEDPVDGLGTFEYPVVRPDAVNRLTLVPGLKLNLKGKMLLSLHALVALKNNGLYARFTPVVGLELTL
jgi:hypothetical protein